MSQQPGAAFLVVSDTHLEMAEALARLVREKLGLEPVLFDIRKFHVDVPFPEHVIQRTFGKVVSFWHPLMRYGRGRGRRGRLFRKMDGFRVHWLGRQAVKKYQIRAVFTFNDRTHPVTTLIRAAQSRKVPVALVQESIRRDEASKPIPGTGWHGTGGCDLIFAWGQTSVDYFERVGVPGERIHAVGNPRMDNLCQYFQTPAESADLREKLAIPAGARVVLLACNPVNTMGMVNSLSTEKYHDSIVQAAHAAGTNGWQVLVKPHLLEMENFRKKGLRAKLEAMPHVRFPDGMHLNACLAASDSVLIFNSTVALESALAGKPCGILMLHPWEHGCDFVENGLACEIRNPDELAAFLDSGSPAQPENIKRYLALTSGSAEMILQDTGDFLKTKTDPNFSSGEQ